jgi:hypothetical protein
MIDKVEVGVAAAVKLGKGISPAYFRYEATYELLPVTEITVPAQPSKVRATAFTRHALPMFLEGPVRHFKVFRDVEEKREAYGLVRNSNLYDVSMRQYFVCESLQDMRQDLGRMKAFSPGWLENQVRRHPPCQLDVLLYPPPLLLHPSNTPLTFHQSIWLHMSYKFYLELLRGGLYEEFFDEIKTGLVPFMDNAVYGRSPLEASSFIVSSAFPDKKMHGAGFQVAGKHMPTTPHVLVSCPACTTPMNHLSLATTTTAHTDLNRPGYPPYPFPCPPGAPVWLHSGIHEHVPDYDAGSVAFWRR